jgi:hypothetical protein
MSDLMGSVLRVDSGTLPRTHRDHHRLIAFEAADAKDAKGDKAVVHALQARRSNRQLDEKIQRAALEILSREGVCFGPALAMEYLVEKHGIHASRDRAAVDDRRHAVVRLAQGRKEDAYMRLGGPE